MPVALKRTKIEIEPAVATRTWMHLVWFAAAGLFVSFLVMSYGLDLSPGLF